MLLELAAGAKLFHAANSTAFADLMIDGHRETWPVRSIRFRSWLRRRYYEATGGAPSPAALRSALDALEAQAQFDAPRRAVYMRSPSRTGGSIWIWPTSIGAPSRSGARVGGWWPRRRSDSGGRPACCRFPYQLKADQSIPLPRSSICQAVTSLCWSSPGSWPRFVTAALIRCWRFPASRVRPRPCCRKSSEP
jgi:hypothetical protein